MAQEPIWRLDECHERSEAANGVYVTAANRIGLEQHLPDTAGIEFWASFNATNKKFWRSSTNDKKKKITVD
jgi:hypothetical protein